MIALSQGTSLASGKALETHTETLHPSIAVKNYLKAEAGS